MIYRFFSGIETGIPELVFKYESGARRLYFNIAARKI
jgi:hypothetical protein